MTGLIVFGIAILMLSAIGYGINKKTGFEQIRATLIDYLFLPFINTLDRIAKSLEKLINSLSVRMNQALNTLDLKSDYWLKRFTGIIVLSFCFLIGIIAEYFLLAQVFSFETFSSFMLNFEMLTAVTIITTIISTALSIYESMTSNYCFSGHIKPSLVFKISYFSINLFIVLGCLTIFSMVASMRGNIFQETQNMASISEEIDNVQGIEDNQAKAIKNYNVKENETNINMPNVLVLASVVTLCSVLIHIKSFMDIFQFLFLMLIFIISLVLNITNFIVNTLKAVINYVWNHLTCVLLGVCHLLQAIFHPSKTVIDDHAQITKYEDYEEREKDTELINVSNEVDEIMNDKTESEITIQEDNDNPYDNDFVKEPMNY